MALILAIEPDRRQASQLTAMVRGRLHAELVLGESAERALAALGQRVPDLILTSALLSPKDEAALGDRLRALDGAAVHVQTLTIPVLASSSGLNAGRVGGVLSALRREKTKSATPDGCDPGVFAEQCREYLERAAMDRAAKAERAALTAQDAVTAKEEKSAHPKKSGRAEEGPAWPEKDLRAAPIVEAPAPESIVGPRAESIDEWETETPVKATVEAEVVPKAPATKTEKVKRRHGLRDFLGLRPDNAEGPASLLAAVAALEAEQQVHVEPLIAEPPFAEQFAQGPEAFTTASNQPSLNASQIALAAEDEALEAGGDDDELDLSSLLDDSPSEARSRRSSASEDDPVVDVYEIDNALLAEPLDDAVMAQPKTEKGREPTAERSWPKLDSLMNEANAAEASTTAAPAPQTTANAKPDETKPWTDILEALRRDAEPPPAKPAPITNLEEPAAEPPAAEASRPDLNGSRKKKKRTKGGPAQDEWGFFDPDQCGFAALIEKLEEITDKDDTPSPKRA
jgi:hypothetical protein